MLGKEFWNCGYGTEVLRSVFSFAFENLGIRCVAADHMSKNVASGRVMQKAGMRLDAVLPDRVYNTDTGSFEALSVYSVKH
jgi:RimJ/RimL family protein N-acetyltransferase